MAERLHDLAGFPTAETPSGGRHYIMRGPDGKQYRNTAKKLGGDVDTRARGGYVIVAPSRTTDGEYRWLEPLDCGPSDLPEPPAWLLEQLDALEAGRSESNRRGDGDDADEAIPEGRRNDALASMAGTLRSFDLSRTEIAVVLHERNQRLCKPPLPAEEVESIAKSMTRYEANEALAGYTNGRWAAVNLSGIDAQADGAAEFIDEDDDHAGIHDPGPFPQHLVDVGGFMGRIIDFNLEGAFMRQPVLALASALAVQAVLAGRRVKCPYGNRTNLYLVAMVGTGGGKDRQFAVAQKVLVEAGLQKLLGPSRFASAAALVTTMEHQPACLAMLDEFGHVLMAANDPKRHPHLAPLPPELCEFYSHAGRLYGGRAYADASKIKTIDQPHLVVLGATTGERFLKSLNRDSVIDGLVSRLLVFEGDDDAEVVLRPEVEIPTEIIDIAKRWESIPSGVDLNDVHPHPMLVPFDEGASDVFDALTLDAREHRKHPDEVVRAVWSRVVQQSLKLALVKACSDAEGDVDKLTITRGAAEWGRDVVLHLSQKMLWYGQSWIAENVVDETGKRLLRFIRNAPSGCIGRSALLKKSKMKSRDFTEIVSTLIEAGEIEVDKSKKDRGPTGVVYKIPHWRGNYSPN